MVVDNDRINELATKAIADRSFLDQLIPETVARLRPSIIRKVGTQNADDMEQNIAVVILDDWFPNFDPTNCPWVRYCFHRLSWFMNDCCRGRRRDRYPAIFDQLDTVSLASEHETAGQKHLVATETNNEGIGAVDAADLLASLRCSRSQTIVRLHCLEGRQFKEIGAAVGLNSYSVGMIYRESMEALRTKLTK